MTIAIDFDGVIAEYRHFKGKGVFGTPIEGVKEALTEFREAGHIIIINTTRLEVHQIAEYMELNGLPYNYINFNPKNIEQLLHPSKVLADVYIDDRGVTFSGKWSPEFIDMVLNFKPYWREL
jgi:hypothetical protein